MYLKDFMKEGWTWGVSEGFFFGPPVLRVGLNRKPKRKPSLV